jgi:hypothetical protein
MEIYMKRLIFLLIVALCASQIMGGHAVVHNTSGATTQEDSITVSFICTDSINNIASADSFLVAIFNPTGDSVYAAGYITSANQIDSIDLGSRVIYRWTEQIATIDAAGEIGTYTGFIIGIDTLDGAGADYLEDHATFSFQLINAEYAALLDSAAWAQKAVDSLAVVLDSQEVILDSLYVVLDSINAIIDSLNASATIADFADGVLDELLSGHTDEGSLGQEMTEVRAFIDSILFWSGFGDDVGSIHKKYATRDTLFIVTPALTDTVGYVVFWHLSGIAGGAPDSTRAHSGGV